MSDGSIKYSRGILLCLVATVSWGGMFPIMTSALRHIDPFTFTCFRYAIAGIGFVILLAVLERGAGFDLKGERVGLAWIFGTAGFAGFQFLVFYGQQLIGEGGELVASIMMATMPMFGFLVNWALRKVVPPKGALVFIALSFIGVVLVVSKGDLSSIVASPETSGPAGLIIFAALCWVIYTAGAAFFPKWSPVKYTAITTVLGWSSALIITLGLLGTGVVDVPSGGQVVAVLPELAYMSIVAGFIAVLSWNMGNKILTPLNGTLFMDVVPITAFTITAILGVVPGTMQLIGATLTALALVGNNVYLRKRNALIAAREVPAVKEPAKATG